MKKLLFIVSAIVFALTAASSPAPAKTLIAYFSLEEIVPSDADAITHATPRRGNTADAARTLQKLTGGDLFAIRVARNYPVGHSDCSGEARSEMRSRTLPELAARVPNIAEYETVFVGYPVWWYVEPRAVDAFLAGHDLRGKTLAPFCTSLGAPVNRSVAQIRSLCPDSTVTEGVTLATESEDFEKPLSAWLQKIGFKR